MHIWQLPLVKKQKKGEKRGGKENLLKNKTAFVESAIWYVNNIGTDIELNFNENLKIDIVPDSNA